MAFPQAVPSLSEDEFRRFQQKVEAFEAPEEVEEGINRHRRALEEDC